MCLFVPPDSCIYFKEWKIIFCCRYPVRLRSNYFLLDIYFLAITVVKVKSKVFVVCCTGVLSGMCLRLLVYSLTVEETSQLGELPNCSDETKRPYPISMETRSLPLLEVLKLCPGWRSGRMDEVGLLDQCSIGLLECKMCRQPAAPSLTMMGHLLGQTKTLTAEGKHPMFPNHS